MTEESLFHEALAKSNLRERAAFLDERCAGQPELRAAVEVLLSAHVTPGSFLETAVANSDVIGGYMAAPEDTPRTGPGPSATADYHPGIRPGEVIAGRYTLMQKIGDGGMGEVWIAKQSEPVKRKVALKLIKPGMDSQAVLQRFEQERQALALMDHPNIAKVLDGGVSAGGRPFFVMELVNGLPLTKFCDDARLSLRERLELFVTICQAVQHAHQKGIIHRDLKPSNVLVTIYDGRPVPKVIDFGVAKATGGKLTDDTLSTQFGAVIGTLEYMSPEQAGFSGHDIDTRADIYSLGVILYELLTGLRPFDAKRLKNAALDEMIRMIREEDPSKPSTRLSCDESLPSLAAVRQTEPRRLLGLLRGELDWVVMKCLEKSRDRRYETATSLARDLQRYLADEPVEARPPSARYRLRKFIRRNRGPMLATASMVVLLVGGIIGTTLGMVRAVQAEKRAISERDAKEKARAEADANRVAAERQEALAQAGFEQARRAVDRSFTLISENRLLTVPGLQPLRKELLEQALTYYREFAEQWRDKPSLRRDLAAAWFRVADITSEIGSTTQAETDYQEAIRLYQAILDDAPNDVATHRSMATCFNNLGNVQLKQERFEPALASFERCLDLRKKLLDQHGKSDELEDGVANVQGNLALVLTDLKRHDEALRCLEPALELRRRHVAAAATPERHHELAGQLNTLGGIRTRLGEYPAAAVAFREAGEQERAAIQGNPAVPEYHTWLGNHCFNLALLAEQYLNRPEEALAARQEAAAVWEKLAADNPAVTDYRDNFAQACVDLGNLLQYSLAEKGDPLPWYQRARGLLEELIQQHPDTARYHSVLGAVLDGLAHPQYKAGDADQAVKSLEEARRQQRRAVELAPHIGQYRRFLSGHLMNLARIYSAQERPDDVLRVLAEVEPVLEQLVKDEPKEVKYRLDLARVHHTAAEASSSKGRNDEAFQLHYRGLAVLEELVTALPNVEEGLESLANTYETLATELTEADRSTESATLREREAAFWLQRTQTDPASHLVTHYARACIERGELAVKTRDWATALAWFQKARTELELHGPDQPDNFEVHRLLGYCLKWIGDVHWVREEPDQAAPAWEAALGVYREKLLPTDPQNPARNATMGGLLHNLGRIHGDAGRFKEALDRYHEAIKHQKIAYAKTPQESRQWLSDHYFLLADTLRTLERPAEAAAATRERVKLWPDDPEELAKAAGEVAMCIRLASQDTTLSEATRKETEKAFADESLSFLQQAVAKGFQDADRLKKHEFFASLRGRPDFEKLVAELEKKSPKTVPPAKRDHEP